MRFFLKTIFFIIYTSTLLFSKDWDYVSYSHTNISGTKNTFIEKTFKGITYNSYIVEKDVYGRRSCTNKKNAKKYALFFGCSQVFGDGVSNKHTLPQLFQDCTRDYQSYNYGISGYGPNDTLYVLQNRDVFKEVSQKKGTAFFVYPIGKHEYRIRLHSDYVKEYAEHPYYKRENDKMIYKGKLKQIQWFTYLLIKIYKKIPIAEVHRQPFPKYPTVKDEELIADILCGIRDEYKRQFYSDSFYVVIYPLPVVDKERKVRVVNLLKKKGLNVVDLYDLNHCTINRNDYVVARWDGHANGKLNKMIATVLAREDWQ